MSRESQGGQATSMTNKVIVHHLLLNMTLGVVLERTVLPEARKGGWVNFPATPFFMSFSLIMDSKCLCLSSMYGSDTYPKVPNTCAYNI